LLFFYSRCPRAQPFVKVGERASPCPMELASLSVGRYELILVLTII